MDRGPQYTSITCIDRLDELKIDPSVGSMGDACDSAMAESWVATFKTELVDSRRFPSFERAARAAGGHVVREDGVWRCPV